MREAMRSAIKSAGPHGATHRFDPPESTSTPYGTGPRKRADQSESTRPLGSARRAGPPDDWISPESTFMLCGQDGGRELVRDRIRRSSGSARIDSPAGIRPPSGATRVDIHAVWEMRGSKLSRDRVRRSERIHSSVGAARSDNRAVRIRPVETMRLNENALPAGRALERSRWDLNPRITDLQSVPLGHLGTRPARGLSHQSACPSTQPPLVRARSAPPVATIPFRALA